MSAPPRVAVVTPYHREPAAMLARCHESVRRQGIAADHLLIADGHPLAVVDGWKTAAHVVLPREHGDNGNTPRGLGALLADREGYDFVAFLDADNWYADGHLASLIDLWGERRTPVCASFRSFHDAAGGVLAITEEDEDALAHIDTSCLLIHRTGFSALPVWLAMPAALSPICDRVFFAGLRHRTLAIASTGRRTVAFRSRYAAHYRAAGRAVPADAKAADALAPAYRYLASAQGVSDCVAALGFWPMTYLPQA